MTATFNPALPAALDRVRFIVGDTNVATAAEVQDETYLALLAANAADENKAALAVADFLILYYGRQPDAVEVTGAVKVDFRSRLAALEQIATRLRVVTGGVGAPASFIQAGTLTTVGELLAPWEPLRLTGGRTGG
jgi:hypothetical protein